jgi:hypothetical protein
LAQQIDTFTGDGVVVVKNDFSKLEHKRLSESGANLVALCIVEFLLGLEMEEKTLFSGLRTKVGRREKITFINKLICFF